MNDTETTADVIAATATGTHLRRTCAKPRAACGGTGWTMTNKRRKVSITVDELERKSAPTLEDLLAFVNGGKYHKFYLKKPKVHPDGSVEEFTTVGARAYRKLITILYAVDTLTQMTETHNGGYTIGDVVEELDSITHETY